MTVMFTVYHSLHEYSATNFTASDWIHHLQSLSPACKDEPGPVDMSPPHTHTPSPHMLQMSSWWTVIQTIVY